MTATSRPYVAGAKFSAVQRIKVARRFEPLVGRTDDPEGCWLWKGSVTTNGYGRFGVGHQQVMQAHRIAWLLANGPIAEGMCVLHRCDVRHCVRPDHLFLGTYADNAQDMARKGRAHLQRSPMAMSGDKHWTRKHPGRFAGERNSAARLTADQVVEIRQRFAAGDTYDAVATAYGTTPGNIGFIVTGKHWPSAGGPITTARRKAGPRRKQA